MKKISLALTLMVIALTANAQRMARFVYMDGSDLNGLLANELVVCAYTESDNEIERLEKKLAKASGDKKKELQDEIKKHKAFSEMFNAGLLEMVKANWSLHETADLTIMTPDELKASKRGYTMIGVRYLTKQSAYYDPLKVSAGLPVIYLQNSGKYGANTDLITMPLIHSQEVDYNKHDLALTLKMFVAVVEANKGAKKRVDVNDVIESMVAKNCNAKSSMELLVNKETLRGIESKEVRDAYGSKTNVMSEEEFLAAYMGSEENLAAVCIGADIAEGTYGPLSVSAVNYCRIVINTVTGEVYGFANAQVGDKAGEAMFKKGHFSAMGECK